MPKLKDSKIAVIVSKVIRKTSFKLFIHVVTGEIWTKASEYITGCPIALSLYLESSEFMKNSLVKKHPSVAINKDVYLLGISVTDM